MRLVCERETESFSSSSKKKANTRLNSRYWCRIFFDPFAWPPAVASRPSRTKRSTVCFSTGMFVLSSTRFKLKWHYYSYYCFVFSEILLFLHQIFYQGLVKKLENWPSVFVGDLFDFLLPVLVVYQEYVRNHHYSLQILTDLKSKSIEFRNLLKRCEEKSKCEGRSLDVFLTYPMHQVLFFFLISKSSWKSSWQVHLLYLSLEYFRKHFLDQIFTRSNITRNIQFDLIF